MARGRDKQRIKLGRFESFDKATGLIVKDRDAEKAAEETRIKSATSHRVAHAYSVSTGSDRVQRIIEAPIEIMYTRRMLDKADPERNRVLYDAACRFRQCWHAAGLNGLGAMDIGRVAGGGGDPAYMMPPTTYVAIQRSDLREARARLGDYFDKWMVAVIIEERSSVDAGKMFTGRMDRETSGAITVEIIRGALTTLASHWGMIGRELTSRNQCS